MRPSKKEKAIARAKSAIAELREMAKILSSEDAPEDLVEEAIRTVNGAYRWTHLDGRKPENYETMELVSKIRRAAFTVKEGFLDLADVQVPRPLFDVPRTDVNVKVDNEAFRAAVAAWVSSERVGSQTDRWETVFKCVKSFGLASEITSAKNLRRTWQDRKAKQGKRAPRDSLNHGG